MYKWMRSQCDCKYGKLCACYTVNTLFMPQCVYILYRNRSVYEKLKKNELSQILTPLRRLQTIYIIKSIQVTDLNSAIVSQCGCYPFPRFISPLNLAGTTLRRAQKTRHSVCHNSAKLFCVQIGPIGHSVRENSRPITLFNYGDVFQLPRARGKIFVAAHISCAYKQLLIYI